MGDRHALSTAATPAPRPIPRTRFGAHTPRPAKASSFHITTHPSEGSHRMPGGPPTLGFSLIIYAMVGLVTLINLKLRRRR